MHRKTRSETSGTPGSLECGLLLQGGCIMEDGPSMTSIPPFVRTVTTACCGMDTDIPTSVDCTRGPDLRSRLSDGLGIGPAYFGKAPPRSTWQNTGTISGHSLATLPTQTPTASGPPHNSTPSAVIASWSPTSIDHLANTSGWSPFTTPGGILADAGRAIAATGPSTVSTSATAAVTADPLPDRHSGQASFFCSGRPVTALRAQSQSYGGDVPLVPDDITAPGPSSAPPPVGPRGNQGLTSDNVELGAHNETAQPLQPPPPLPPPPARGASARRRHQRHYSMDCTAATTATSAGSLGLPGSDLGAVVLLKRPSDHPDRASEGGGRTASRSRAGSHGAEYSVVSAAVAVDDGRSFAAAQSESLRQQQLLQLDSEPRVPEQGPRDQPPGPGAGAAVACAGSGSSKARERQRGSNGRSTRELALLDPKKAQRVLANRLSAAKSKERKQQYAEQLRQTLSDSAAEQEALIRQLERLQADGTTLESFLREARREAQQLEEQLAAVRQQNEALRQQLLATAATERGHHVAAEAEAAEADLPRELIALLQEPLLPEDEAVLEVAGRAPGLLQLELQQQPQPQHLLRPGAPAAAPTSGSGGGPTCTPSMMIPCMAALGVAGGGIDGGAPQQFPGDGSAAGAATATATAAVAAVPRSYSGGGLGVGFGDDLGLQVAEPGLLGLGPMVGPGGGGGENCTYSLSMPEPMDVALHRAEAEALAEAEATAEAAEAKAAKGAVACHLGSDLATAGDLSCMTADSTGTGAAATGGCDVDVEMVMMGQSLEKGVVGLAIAPAGGEVEGLMSVRANGGRDGDMPGFLALGESRVLSTGGGALLPGYGHGHGGSEGGGGLLTGPALPQGQLPFLSRQITTALRPTAPPDAHRQ
ncbi:hypothetical protein VOLCADRAFT_88185 [Volvox carteri f. nagariensis]|uniref:BZIP domain-containing protein n=1 Tax=Volvox carteri f. nagariensis TaxID=3068 RepID=D8TNI0_VOLCA|nr:uncharacterized protein VOLCADRAFT_88185 [Volvox carteri f. nagariensis]EFJ50843.1 hypothetical protein VOLCADRAFT_88185 [Volvox carteri f. nagariensis]|eukprot:XP_002947855.1 hypothetical protein VOLCADRAFT_88185 [Volvox carteri f. nagariensis]